MKDRNILIIKNSWSYLINQSDEVGLLFYEKLFELDPGLKPMFHNDMEKQIQKLMDMITFMVTRLQTMTDIENDIDALALRHVKYGVRNEHYQIMGEALLWALQNSLGNMWDDDTNNAWMELYNFLALSMTRSAGVD